MCVIRSYDSNMDDSRDNKKNRFSNTMVFMEEYLNNVLNDELPFHDEEKNKLTYEVRPHSSACSLILGLSPSFSVQLVSCFLLFFSLGGEFGQTFDLLWFLQFLWASQTH